MTKDILLSTTAQKQFDGLDKATKERIRAILKRLSTLKDEKEPGLDIKKLRGIKNREDLFRLRVGEYRIVYFIEKDAIKVIQIIHRSRGYDWL